MCVALGGWFEQHNLRQLSRGRVVQGGDGDQQTRWRKLARVDTRFLGPRRRFSEAAALAALLDDIARRCATGESIRQAFESAATTSQLASAMRPSLVAVQQGATL